MKHRTSKLFPRTTRKRFGVTFTFAALFTLLLASTAWAENITGYFRTTGPGQRVYGDMNGEAYAPWAGTLASEIDGQDVGTFCTDLEHPIYYNEAFVYEGPATCRVAWLVTNYPPLLSSDAYPDSPPTTPLSNRSNEMSARQAAVWYLSDGFVLNSQTPQEIRDRTQQIIDSVPEPCEITLETPDLDITPADVTDIYPDEETQAFTVTATRGGQPMEGLVVSLSLTPETGFGLSDDTVTTGEDGSTTFTVTAAGLGSVEIGAEATFTLPTGMMFSPVDGEGQRLVLGQATPGSVFAGVTATWVRGGTIVGHVFHDRNMNGTQDEGEKSLEGWTVTLYDDASTQLESGSTAGEAGNYLFDGPGDAGLLAGTYSIHLTDQGGYQRTTEAQVPVELTTGGHGVANFGVVSLPVVQVCKYEDLNESGSHDEGEPWLSGWEMQLYEGDDNSAVISGHGSTGDDGCVVLGFFDESYYEPGTPYYVGESLKEGWVNVSPITQSIELAVEDVEIVHFGNVHPEPAISLAKSGPTSAHENDSITYDFTVTNEGNVRLSGSVSDPLLPGLECSFTELAPGESYTCHGTYVVPEGADNPLSSTASVSASDAYDHSVGASDSHSVNILHPAIEVVKTASVERVDEGDPVEWTITVYNRGDTPLDVTVTDNNGMTFGPLTLTAADGDDQAGDDQATWTYETQPTYDTINVATASGTDTLGLVVTGEDQAGVEVTTSGDMDGDGVPDYLDSDSDGDGIPNNVEGEGDTDGDGIPNYLDTDSDGDGIPDAIEGTGDVDGDGLPNYLDTDSDGDSIPDAIEGAGDVDGDGLPNFLDTDSDGDGIPDEVEWNSDADGDGDVDAADRDADGDGTPNYLDTDSDGDGIPDRVEWDVDADGDGDVDAADRDADGDGIPNYLDIDSDGDGIPDAIEGTGDVDGDGIPNFVDPDEQPQDPRPYRIYLSLVAG